MSAGSGRPRSASAKRRQHVGPPVLVICGRGFVATSVLDLLPLLKQAGFAPHVAFIDEAPAWVPLEPVRRLSGASVSLEAIAPAGPDVSRGTTPNWVHRSDRFVATFALGLSNSALFGLSSGNLWDWLPGPFKGRTGPAYLWVDAEELGALTVPDLSPHGIFDLRVMPALPGRIRAAVEAGFAAFIAGWQQRAALGRKTFLLERLAPNEMQGILHALPEWHLALRRRLLTFGMKQAVPGSLSITDTFSGSSTVSNPGTLSASSPLSGIDLIIDTFEGPYSKAAPPGSSYGTPLSPGLSGATTAGGMNTTENGASEAGPDGEAASSRRRGPVRVQFLHSLVPDAILEWLLDQQVIVVVRESTGDLLVREGDHTRLFPDLAERPAMDRLADLLASRLLASAS